MNQASPRLPAYFFRTAPQPCPYLAGRVERNLFAELAETELPGAYDLLVHHGFRRSHRIVYRPDCPGCQACVSVRVVTERFTPGRSLRRVWRTNADLAAAEVRCGETTLEQFRLFRRYVAGRHEDGEMARMGLRDYRAMVQDTVVDTRIVEFRDPAGALVGCTLVDRLGDGLSAVYSFFDPALGGRSLGTYSILWLIERCREQGLPYAYLGYWIAASRKMAYKARFQPLEALGAEGWRAMPLPASHCTS